MNRLELEDGKLPPPIIENNYEGDGIHIQWTVGDEVLSVEATSNGVEWFYRNRKTDEIAGTEEDAERKLPSEFFQKALNMFGGTAYSDGQEFKK